MSAATGVGAGAQTLGEKWVEAAPFEKERPCQFSQAADILLIWADMQCSGDNFAIGAF